VDLGAFEVQGVTQHIVIAGGDGQTAAVDTAFGRRLGVRVIYQDGTPVPGVAVRFRLPGNGPGARFAGGLLVADVTTDARGIARSPALTANGVAGPFGATATAQGLGGVTFRLTNVKASLPPPRVARFVVNQGNPQRSVINSLTLVFDQQVAILPEVFRLTRVVIDDGRIVRRLEVYPVALADVRVVGGRTHATLRLPTPLADGTYQLFVNRGRVRNAEGDILAGPNAFRFFQLTGDLDGDGRR
jgi:hypothetical protein